MKQNTKASKTSSDTKASKTSSDIPEQNWSAHKAVALSVQFNNKMSEFVSVLHLYPVKHILQTLTDNYLKFTVKQESTYGGQK